MITRATVDIEIQSNATWLDAFQLGTVGDTSWSFVGQNFRCDVKVNRDAASSLITMTTANGQVIIDDPIQRVLHFNVPETALAAAGILPGNYVYELVMYDNSTPAIRVPMMGGKLRVKIGIAGG
jgi:hypothetical protein